MLSILKQSACWKLLLLDIHTDTSAYLVFSAKIVGVKMNSRKTILGACILVLATALIFLLLPVGSKKHHIEFDETKIQGKRDFLEEITRTDLPQQQQRPNILFILADDLGINDISLYNDRGVDTPHIDAIGHGGVVFTDAYCTSAICSPSRAAIMTGRYQQRFGHELQTNDRYPRNRLEYLVFKHILDIGFWRVAELAVPRKADIARQGLAPGEITLAELLRSSGYATGLIGKWHLGHEEPFLPLDRGFQVHYGFYEAFTLYDQIDDPNVVNRRLNEFSDRHQWRQGRRGTSAIRLNHEIIDEQGYLTDRIAEEAVRFLKDHATQPFFLCVPFSAPHVPYQAQRQYYDGFAEVEDETRRVYRAMIRNLDDAVGRITDKIDELGLERDTLIIFASDNGGARHTGATDNAPLKGGKFTNFEGGLNIPFMLRWDGALPEGDRCSQPVSLMDVFATAAAASSVPLPTDRPYDGVDLLPFLLDKAASPPHRVLFWRSLYNKAVRKGEWKLILNERSGQILLYNLDHDRREKVNLAPRYPEIIAELLDELERWEEQLQPPSWPRVMDVEFIIDGKAYRFAI
jgi:arylsulfatase A-like enzyme